MAGYGQSVSTDEEDEVSDFEYSEQEESEHMRHFVRMACMFGGSLGTASSGILISNYSTDHFLIRQRLNLQY